MPLQPLPPQLIWFANAEPSALQVLSVEPSELQATELGIHLSSVHSPASTLQSAADAQSSFFMSWPASVHTESWTPSQWNVPGLHTAHMPEAAPISHSAALMQDSGAAALPFAAQ